MSAVLINDVYFSLQGSDEQGYKSTARIVSLLVLLVQSDRHGERRVSEWSLSSSQLLLRKRMFYDPNDPEFQEAMKYLALPADEKLKLRSQAFDAKKACWVPDPKESYIAAEIESTKDDQVTVKTCKGDVGIFSLSLPE